MSHSKGFFAGTCPGDIVKNGRPSDGIQKYKCPKCGRIEQKTVSKCWFFHNYTNRGKPSYGVQKQTCSKCGDKRETQARRCWFFHKWRRTRRDPEIKCIRCGIPYEEAAA